MHMACKDKRRRGNNTCISYLGLCEQRDLRFSTHVAQFEASRRGRVENAAANDLFSR